MNLETTTGSFEGKPKRLGSESLVWFGLALLLLVPTMVAGDNEQPIPKVGSCPVGYRTSGNYCIPLQNTDQEVIIKLKSCPPGYRTSGNYCIKS